jgi:hypothetical protein
MPFVPKELAPGVLSMPDSWPHQVEENFQLKLILAEKEAEIKMNQLEKREAKLRLKEAQVEMKAMEVERRPAEQDAVAARSASSVQCQLQQYLSSRRDTQKLHLHLCKLSNLNQEHQWF